MSRTSLLFTLLVFVAPPVLGAQQLPLALYPHEADDAVSAAVQARGGKSPTLAALLSWFVWPGVGSYYAGNSGHGTRHVLIGVAAVGAAVPLLITCDNDGFCDFDNDTARLSIAVGLGAVYLANSVWSVLTAISDAEDFNARLGSERMSLGPAVKVLPSPFPAQGAGSVGMQIATLRF
jgi:hypothetical protein